VASASRVLLVEPAVYAANAETAEDNAFQLTSPTGDLESARGEVRALAASLEDVGVAVRVFPGPPDAPDAAFPNNWFSTFPDGTAVLYPMRSPARRLELRGAYPEVVDMTGFETSGEFLEGTGSLVIDSARRLAFASLSPRTHERTVELWCEQFEHRPVLFDSAIDGHTVYHTNVVLSIGDALAVVCLEAVPAGQAEVLRRALWAPGRTVIEVSVEQAKHYCANVLELVGPVVACSARAWDAFDAGQRATIERVARPVVVPVPAIEAAGGGSVRCMIAELF
jgi:hypothetical protein